MAVSIYGNGINYNGGFSDDMFATAEAGKESEVCKRAGAFSVVKLKLPELPGPGYLVIPKGYRVFADDNTELIMGQNCFEIEHFIRVNEHWYRRED